jgi:hypothetical protein
VLELKQINYNTKQLHEIEFEQWIMGVGAAAITIAVSGLETTSDVIKITCGLLSTLLAESKSLLADVILQV